MKNAEGTTIVFTEQFITLLQWIVTELMSSEPSFKDGPTKKCYVMREDRWKTIRPMVGSIFYSARSIWLCGKDVDKVLNGEMLFIERHSAHWAWFCWTMTKMTEKPVRGTIDRICSTLQQFKDEYETAIEVHHK